MGFARMGPGSEREAVNGLRRGYARGPFGQIHYARAGSGEPVLLLHQTPRSWDEFERVIELLAGSYDLIAMDLPGMGASDAAPGSPTIEGFADAAVALLDDLGLGEVDVFGHHTGSFVAVDVAARYPDRARSVMLSAPAWGDAEFRAANSDPETLGVDNAAPDENGEYLLELWRQRQPFYPPESTDLLATFMRDALRVEDPRAGHIACGRYELDAAFARIACPLLLLGFAEDPHSFPHLEQFTSRAPDAAVRVIEGGTVPLDAHPREVAAAIEEFLAQR